MVNTVKGGDADSRKLNSPGKDGTEKVVDETHLGIERIIVTPEFFQSYF